jgi:hypothetical protein
MILTDESGRTVDVTAHLDRCRKLAHAFDDAIQEYIETHPDADHDEAVEALTVNYTRACIEEDGYNALRDLIDFIDGAP